MNKRRLPVLMLIFTSLFLVLVGRTFYLQILKHSFFEAKSQRQVKRFYTLHPNRGNIFDRHNQPITSTKTSYSAYFVPPQIDREQFSAEIISNILGLSAQHVLKLSQKNSTFVWLNRKLDDESYAALKALNLKGLGFIKEDKRLYPKGSFAAHVLGFVGIDNQGLAGLEYIKDDFLNGEPGKIVLEGDPRGFRLISGKKWLTPPKDGGDIISTLDEFIQFSTEKHLKTYVEKFDAKQGQAVVMNPKTGEVLAMASYPHFDPNTLPESGDPRRNNKAVTDIFEPGSIFKIITVAGVLEEKLYQKDSILDVPETLNLMDRTIKEAHERPEGEGSLKTVEDILVESLNVGTTMLAQKLGQERLYKYMRDFGFGKKTGIDLPGESPGLLRPLRQWSGVDIGMMSFGQGIGVTAIQMVNAFAVLANDGILLNPRIIRSQRLSNRQIQGNPTTVKRRIISKKTARALQEMLLKNVEEGTGKSTFIEGFDLAGKTGTAQKAMAEGGGYEKGAYIASFGGFFPAKNAKYAMLVLVDHPQGSIYGSQVAAPVFHNIAKDIIRQKGLIPFQ